MSDSTNPGKSDAADQPDAYPDSRADSSPDASTEAYPDAAAGDSDTAASPPPAPPAYSAPSAPAEYGTPPSYGATPPAYSAATPPAYGATPPAYGTAPAYGAAPTYGAAPAYGGGYGAQPKTNTLAIVSLIAGIAGLVLIPLIGSLTAVITGHMSLSQIKRTGEGGRGLGLTGTILGWVGIAFGILLIVLLLALIPFIVMNARTYS